MICSVFVEFILGSEDSAVAVGVLEGTISIGDHEGDLPLLQQDQVGQESLLQPVDGEVVLAVLEIAAQPVLESGVVLFPGVGRGDDQEPSRCQHFLVKLRSDLSSQDTIRRD